jgi:hypothetical protein
LLDKQAVVFRRHNIERPHAADQLFLGSNRAARPEGIDEFEALVLQDEDADLRGRHRGPEHCFLIAHFHRVVC